MSFLDLSSPESCLQKLTVVETLFSRMVPSKERDQSIFDKHMVSQKK